MPLELQVAEDSSSEQTLRVILIPIPTLPMRLQKVGTSKRYKVSSISQRGSTDYTNTHSKECGFCESFNTIYI